MCTIARDDSAAASLSGSCCSEKRWRGVDQLTRGLCGRKEEVATAAISELRVPDDRVLVEVLFAAKGIDGIVCLLNARRFGQQASLERCTDLELHLFPPL